jgi:hypothetical protein
MPRFALSGTTATAIAGAIFFALIVIHSQLRGSAPAADDPSREVLRYLSGHQGRLQLGAVALGFAMPVALVWLAGFFRVVRRAEGDGSSLSLCALGGGILAAAGTVTSALVEGALGTRAADIGPGVARFGWTLFLLGTGATLLGLLLLIAATAAAGLRWGRLPRWIAQTSVILAFISAVGALSIGYGSDALQSVAGIAILLDSGWILAFSILLWRDPELGS